jgi:hypothetical protein
LTVGCQKQIFHIQEENNFNNTTKIYRNDGGDWTTIATTFDCHYESMESWVEMKNVKTPTSI